MAAYRDLDRAVTEWLNACDLSRKLESITGLSDGLLLGEFLGQVSAAYFGKLELKTEFSAGWSDKLRNLQRIETAMKAFAAQIRPFSPHFTIDLVPIAVAQDLQQLHNLLVLVVFCVLNSPAKDLLVTRILQLSQPSQVALMHFIKLVTQEEDASDFVMTPTREIHQLRKAQATLSTQLANVQSEYEAVANEKERIEQEFSELKLTNTDLESKVSRIRRREYTPDSLTLALESQLVDRDMQIRLLNEQLAEERKTHERLLSGYMDELDTVNAKIAEFSEANSALQALKQALEELKPLKEQLHISLQENEYLHKQLQEYRNSEDSSHSSSQQITSLKDSLIQEKSHCALLETQLLQQDTNNKALLKDNLDLVEKLHFLEAKNRELTLKMEQSESLVEENFTPLHELPEASVHSETYEEDSKVSRVLDFWASDKSLKGLKETVALANELKELATEKDNLAERLKTVLLERDLERAAAAAEVSSLKEALSKEVQALQTALNDSEAAFRLTIRDLSDQITHLSASAKAIDMLNRTISDEITAVRAERDSLWTELSGLYRDKDQLSGRFVASRDETMRLNTELVEKTAIVSGLEQELAVFKQEDRTLTSSSSLELQLLDSNRRVSELKMQIMQLGSELKGKETVLVEVERQLSAEKEKNRRCEHRSRLRKSRLVRVSRTKEELEAVVSQERGVMQAVTLEMMRTMGELQSLARPLP